MDIWHDLIEEVRQQHRFLDLLCGAWKAEYAAVGGTIQCGRGCRGCCSLAVNATLTEAVALARTLSEEQATALSAYIGRLLELLPSIGSLKEYLRMHRQVLGYCPLLDSKGCCGVYDSRPISCRALLSTRESRWCEIDFSSLGEEEKQAFMESLDRGVVNYPTHYVATTADTGQELEATDRQRMTEVFGFSLYGSLPAMVYLVRQHGLAEASSQGYQAVAQLIARAGMDNAFLLHLERPER